MGDGAGDLVGLGLGEAGVIGDSEPSLSGELGDGVEEGWIGVGVLVVAPFGVGGVTDVVEEGDVALARPDVAEALVGGSAGVQVDVFVFCPGLLVRHRRWCWFGQLADGSVDWDLVQVVCLGQVAVGVGLEVEGVGEIGEGVVPEDDVGVMADDLAVAGGRVLFLGVVLVAFVFVFIFVASVVLYGVASVLGSVSLLAAAVGLALEIWPETGFSRAVSYTWGIKK